MPLAALADPGLVLSVALQALGLSAEDDANRRALLVLDNFEHLIDAAPAIARFLSESPGPTLLVTSRIPLHVSMETEYPLDPLPQGAAVELFLDRAHAVRRSAEPSPEVDEICRRLDCLPLALELAAARLKLLDPAALLDRLDSRLSLLTRGPADLPERHQTLEATIAWSYDLLDPEVQSVFLRLSVFAGSFGIDAAEAVADADLEVLTTLTEASLLKARGDSRFLILETIREFARQRLPVEEAMRLPSRHGHYYLSVAEQAAPQLTGHDAGAWLAALDADYGNFRAALDWFALESPQHVPRLTISLWRFWLVRGRYEEGQRAIERALGLSPTPIEHAELQYQLGAIVISRGDTARGRAVFQDALERFREQGQQHGEARSLSALGHVAADAGAWSEAIDRYEEAAAVFRRSGEQFGLGGVLGDLANTYLRSDSPGEALPLAIESRVIQRRVGNRQGEALALAIEGYAHLGLGQPGPGAAGTRREHRHRAQARLSARPRVQPERARSGCLSLRRRGPSGSALRRGAGAPRDHGHRTRSGRHSRRSRPRRARRPRPARPATRTSISTGQSPWRSPTSGAPRLLVPDFEEPDDLMSVQVLHDPVDVAVLHEHVGIRRILVVVEPEVFERAVVLAGRWARRWPVSGDRDSVRSR